MTDRFVKRMFAPAALAELKSRVRFNDAVDELAGASLWEFAHHDETGRWMFRDLGGSSLYFAAVVLDAMEGGLTAAALAQAARFGNVASRGRVMAFIRRAQAVGELTLAAGPGPWTRRRLHPSAKFIERFRLGNKRYAEAVAVVAPEVEHLVPLMDNPDFFRLYVLAVAGSSLEARVSDEGHGGGERIFLERDRGASILFRLMLSQPRPRPRLLVEAELSRSRLAREFGVSRVHINRLLADASAAGLLSLSASDHIVFSQALSDEVEHMMAITLQITRAALLAAEIAYDVESPLKVMHPSLRGEPIRALS